MTDGQRPTEDEALRIQAERRLEHLSLPSKWTDWSSYELTHELNVHRIEIELQNEELQQTLSELEFERRQYISLYEHSPSAYFTLDARGDILKTPGVTRPPFRRLNGSQIGTLTRTLSVHF